MELTSNIERVVESIHSEKPELPKDAIALASFFRISQIVQHFNIRMWNTSLKGSPPLVNLYAILFAPSGVGKSYLLNRTKDILHKGLESHFEADFMKHYDAYVASKTTSYIQNNPEVSEKEKEKYIRSLWERVAYLSETSRGTLEGILRARNLFSRAGIGAGAFIQDEFAEYILSPSQTNKEMLDILKETYDGNSNAKILSTAQSYKAVNGVPQSMFVATSQYNLFQNGGSDRLWSFFSRGYARRAFLCNTKEVEVEQLSAEEEYKLQLSKVNASIVNSVSSVSMKMYESLKSWCFNEKGLRGELSKVVPFNEDADRTIFMYKRSNKLKGNLIKEEHKRAEVNDRWYRASKLACLIALFEHPELREVTSEDIQSAISITEYYGSQFDGFFEEQVKPDYMILFDFLYSNLNKGFARTELYSVCPLHSTKAKYWLDTNLEMLQEYLSVDGLYNLEIEKDGRKTTYKLERTTNESLEELLEAAENETDPDKKKAILNKMHNIEI